MRDFKDNTGRTWSVQIDVDAVRRVRTALQLNLVAADFEGTLKRLLDDPVLLCDAIYIVCKPRADADRVSPEDFGRAMAGDVIEQATKAFLEELANFTPNPRDRARVHEVLKAMWTLAERIRDRADRETAEAIRKADQGATSGPSSSSSPGSSESTPVRSP